MSGADLDERPPDTVPRTDAFGDVFDRLLELADEHLEEPVAATVDAYDDGTYRVQVYHHIPPDEREVLYYHSDEGVIRYGVEDLGSDTLKTERVVESLEPTTGSKKERT